MLIPNIVDYTYYQCEFYSNRGMTTRLNVKEGIWHVIGMGLARDRRGLARDVIGRGLARDVIWRGLARDVTWRGDWHVIGGIGT